MTRDRCLSVYVVCGAGTGLMCERAGCGLSVDHCVCEYWDEKERQTLPGALVEQAEDEKARAEEEKARRRAEAEARRAAAEARRAASSS